ncbi:MAG: acetylxylan esterase [Candidatus Hydrogenedentes bacterium]|nr:acetylxylan esterase [Candidatus Hydrogenedentota bacterium]
MRTLNTLRWMPLMLTYLMISPALFPAMAWPGFDWDTWRDVTKVEKPALDTPQAGLAELLPLLASVGPDSPRMHTHQAWQAKQARVRQTLEALLGQPTSLVSVPASAEVLGEEDMGDYIRRHVRIASSADDAIPAYILIPKNLGDAPAPVMLVLHQTQAPGKQEAVGMTGNPEMAFGPELVARGFICVAPDVIGFGERIPDGAQPYANALDFYRRHPQWSFFGKMAWDVQRIVDYIETMPEADASRIGSIGHSHGAYGTIMATIFEPRIKASVASCGFTTLRTDPAPNRWSHLTALMPRLGFYVDDVKEAPLDWHEILACIAPRPFFNWATLEDDIFPNTANLEDVYAQVHEVYALYDKPGDFQGRLGPGAHAFPKEIREEAYDWLEAQLNKKEE